MPTTNGSFSFIKKMCKNESATFSPLDFWWLVNREWTKSRVCNGFFRVDMRPHNTHSFIRIWSKAKHGKATQSKTNREKAKLGILHATKCVYRTKLFVCACVLFFGKIDPYWSVRQQNLSLSFQQLHKWFAAWTFPSWFVCDTCSLNQNMNSAFLARTGWTGGTRQIQWTQSEEISDWFVVELRATEKRARRLHRSV